MPSNLIQKYRTASAWVDNHQGFFKTLVITAFLVPFLVLAHMVTSLPKQGPSSVERIAAANEKLEAKQHDRNNHELGLAVDAARRIKEAARNPDSIVFEKALWMQDGAVCLLYHGQNGFGGMTKNTALEVSGTLFVRGDSHYTTAEFRKAWKNECDDGQVKEDIAPLLKSEL